MKAASSINARSSLSVVQQPYLQAWRNEVSFARVVSHSVGEDGGARLSSEALVQSLEEEDRVFLIAFSLDPLFREIDPSPTALVLRIQQHTTEERQDPLG